MSEVETTPDGRRIVRMVRDLMQQGPFGTYSRLDTGTYQCVILERPKFGDHPCIPLNNEGYDVNPKTNHPHHNPCYEVMNVKDRTAILIHSANIFEQLLGCLAPGKVITDRIEVTWEGQVISHKGIMQSHEALAGLISDLEFKPFKLIITEA